MKRVLIIIFLIIFPQKIQSQEALVALLKEDAKIIFIRHAIAPGNGDPDNFDVNNCDTQRNLSIEGIKQSEEIGNFFKKNNIEIGIVLSSEWCRCKDTAKFAFNNYKTFDALNSFYSEKFSNNKSSQIKKLKKYIKKWDGKKNLIFVTHYVVILEMLNVGVSSGEIVISNKNLDLIGGIKINN